MPQKKALKVDGRIMRRSRDLVIKHAKRYDVDPLKIVNYARGTLVDKARKEVWRIMIGQWGLKRHQVATMFKRDVRRLRKSVIGI